jgi:hypothetical protein
LAAFAQGQQEATNFNQMLWALYQDMAENPDLHCPIFQTNLGPLPKEAFYTEEAYEQVTLLFSFILTNIALLRRMAKVEEGCLEFVEGFQGQR